MQLSQGVSISPLAHSTHDFDASQDKQELCSGGVNMLVKSVYSWLLTVKHSSQYIPLKSESH